MHIWDDYVYVEIVDPATGAPVPDGEWGEICLTTLVKEGAPLIRFRTHDLSRIIPGECPCGSRFPRIDTIQGRSDDMFKIHGVNVFPRQIPSCATVTGNDSGAVTAGGNMTIEEQWEDVYGLIAAASLGDGADASAARVQDPITLLCRLTSQQDDGDRFDAEVARAEDALGLMRVGVSRKDGLLSAGEARGVVDATETCAEAPAHLRDLAQKAQTASDMRSFEGMPNAYRRPFMDALQHALDGVSGLGIEGAAAGLYLLCPHTYIPLSGRTRAFLVSPDGLGIEEQDLPTTARDYLDLLCFLHVEMAEARLPYVDAVQLVRAAQEGRTVRDGLASRDRADLIARRVRPALERLYPRDPARVDEECRRLER